MTSQLVIDLLRSSSDVAWGFRLQGGSEYGSALSIQRVFSGTPSDGNLQRGDVVSKVNGNDVTHLTLNQAQELIKMAGNRLSLNIQRDSHPQQDLHASAQVPSFVPSDCSPPRHPPNQPTQHFHSNSFSDRPVSNLKFQPQPDHQNDYNQQHYQHHHDPQHHHAWQPHDSVVPSSSSSEPHQHHHHQQHEDEGFYHEEHVGDVDDEHLRPVKETKSMFNHGSHDGAHVIRKGHPVSIAQSRKPQGTTKYQPPSPALKPATATHVQSAKNPPVYQQRSSYNPLDFQGVTPKSPIPPSRPPGLIQRGAVDLKPRGTGLDYQQTGHLRPDHHHHQNVSLQPQHHHQPSITPQGNLDPLTDFYLHGLNAKSQLPDFTKSQTASYSGKILPPRSEVTIKTPSSAPKKKEFQANQSAVYRILQEEEEGRQRSGQGQGQGKRGEDGSGQKYQIPGSGGHSRLAELLERDQSQLAQYRDEEEQYHYQQQQEHPQYHYQQQQQHPQYLQSPTKHTSTAQFVPSPNREQAPRHDYNDHHGNYQQHHHQQQQHHYQNWAPQEAGRLPVTHSGLPETDF